MRYINHHITDPYFNIASEEFLLKYSTDEIFLLYIDLPSVIVGKHQNTFAEVNLPYVHVHQIPVIRRLSGGGTVFHDSGNLNFSFITNNEPGKQIDFKRYTEPLLNVLLLLGAPASSSGRNDLLVDGLKISGNAEHVYKNRTLHHGTLLFDSQLDSLRDAIHVNKDQFSDNAVKSVRSPVTNIKNYLKTPCSMDEFRHSIISHLHSITPCFEPGEFTDAQIQDIELLASTKYATWEWNYGYSPKCHIQKQSMTGSKLVEVELEITKGKITRAIIQSENHIQEAIQDAILNQKYDISVLTKLLEFTSEPEVWTQRLF